MLELTIIIPLFAGGVIMFFPVQLGRKIMVATGLIHLLLSLSAVLGQATPCVSKYFTATPEGLLILLVTSFIFFFISIYAVSYMEEVEISSESIYLGCTMLFLSSMSMVALADHLVVLWIAIEATTLMSAPLIF
ncbi:MAG: hydrogenase, partial [Candidatus Electrothrix sp. AR4]|nr:hydrogenase [Candidatus Electrothrix sp. AR4]